jgi:hypothetical protein
MKKLFAVISVIVFSGVLARAEEKMSLRAYPFVRPSVFMDVITERSVDMGGSFAGGVGGDAARFTRTEADRLQQQFVECGVTFPEGSFIRYNSRIQRLFSRNTEENQNLIKYLLTMWGILQYQVQLDLAFVAFERSAVDELAQASATATPKTADLQALRQKGSGKTLVGDVFHHPQRSECPIPGGG